VYVVAIIGVTIADQLPDASVVAEVTGAIARASNSRPSTVIFSPACAGVMLPVR
jgi:hypothetical protein